MDKVNLPNQVSNPPFTCSVSYGLDAANFNFDISIKNAKSREYALVFRNADNSEYTAAIVSSHSHHARASVMQVRLMQARKLSLIDIESEELVFISEFAGIVEYPPDKNLEHEIYDEENAAPAIDETEDSNMQAPIEFNGFTEPVPEKNVDEEDLLKDFEGVDFELPSETNEKEKDETPLFSIPSEDDPSDELSSFDIYGNEEVEELLNTLFDDFEDLSGEEKLSSMQSADGVSDTEISFVDETADSEHMIGFTPEVPSKAPARKKRYGYLLLNDNPMLLDEYFHTFSSFEAPLKNRVFYILDEAAAEEHSLRVTLNGYNVPLTTPFLEYKSSSVKDTNYPDRLIGTLMADNAVEYFIFGSLGKNSADEQPFMGATGFAYFEPIKGEDIGYWLSYLSTSTGKIALPMKPKKFE